MTTSEHILVPILLPPTADPLRPAVAAYLARFKDQSRAHPDSDLRCYLRWCTERDLDPLSAQRPHVELYVRWMREVHSSPRCRCAGCTRAHAGLHAEREGPAVGS